MDLSDLHGRIREARRIQEEPPPPNGEKRILPLTDYLDDEDYVLVHRAVRAIRRVHPETFNLYQEGILALLMVDALAERSTAPTLAALADELAAREEDRGPWLISTPLANILTPEPVTALDEETVLWRAELGTEWMDQPFGGSDDRSEFRVHELLGDRLRRPTRWIRLPGDARIDTRRGATLLSVETASVGLAISRAVAKARYAIAVWAILSPPTRNQLLPDLGIWAPQPWLQLTEPYKRREHGQWTARETARVGSVRQWVEYPAPDPETLRVPFAAIANLERRCAQATLSASLALFQASRPTRFTLSERLRNAHTAIDALCEPGAAGGGIPTRWANLARHYGVWDHLSELGYDREDIEEMQPRLYGARNVATHGADAVLLDQGYPADSVRRMRNRPPMTGSELALAGLSADLTPLISAVRHVLRAVLLDCNDNGWSDEAFEERFAPCDP